ncbi:FIST signal transduction protein [Rasiella sp. SM2506]|uniref:FIST signal transduction protein n=1 Tax=Rasiella sp. SM2506 TaxID=3423914 RepID=UPI003D78E5AC
MKSVTLQANTSQEIENKVNAEIKNGFKPTLAIVFLSVKQDYKAICKIFDAENISVFGATSSGEFVGNDITEGAIVLMLLDMDPAYFRIKFLETGTQSTYENAIEIGVEGKNTFNNPGYLMVSGWLTEDGEQIVAGLVEGAGKDVTIFGGMAGDDLLLEGPEVFTNKQSSVNGLVALIIDEDKIDIRGIATCGWKPIGTTKTITKSEGNIVYTIDNKPALDMILKYLGVEIDLDSNKEVVTNISSYYPLQLERDGVTPVMRTAMFANKEDRSIICAGNVPQGAKVRFSLPPDFDSIDTVITECEQLKDTNKEQADALIMFSCISRHLSFGLMITEELERVQAVWDAPMIGFFTYGEFGKSKTGKHEFHNNTCCVVALKEK